MIQERDKIILDEENQIKAEDSGECEKVEFEVFRRERREFLLREIEEK